jgi:hypothetical protein
MYPFHGYAGPRAAPAYPAGSWCARVALTHAVRQRRPPFSLRIRRVAAPSSRHRPSQMPVWRRLLAQPAWGRRSAPRTAPAVGRRLALLRLG